MKLDSIPRISGAGFHALFDGREMIGVTAYAVDDAALQEQLPEAHKLILRAAKGARGTSSAFVITDPPPLPEGVDPAALTVALTFVKEA